MRSELLYLPARRNGLLCFSAAIIVIAFLFILFIPSSQSWDAATLPISNHSVVGKIAAPEAVTSLKVNFQDATTIPPTGWLRDFGQPYGSRTSAYQGSGNIYGWINVSNTTSLDLM